MMMSSCFDQENSVLSCRITILRILEIFYNVEKLLVNIVLLRVVLTTVRTVLGRRLGVRTAFFNFQRSRQKTFCKKNPKRQFKHSTRVTYRQV